MSKKSWRLVGWFFLALSFAAVLSLAAADFLEIHQADLKAQVNAGKKSSRQSALNEESIPRPPILVRSSQHLNRKIDSTPACLPSR